MADFPYLYLYARMDAKSMHEEREWWDSFYQNVECARDI